MPKQTKKFVAAQVQLSRLGVSASGYDQEQDYRKLSELGYQWDSTKGKWVRLDSQPAKPASQVTRVRVWAASHDVQRAADDVLSAMQARGYQLVEVSTPYPCRPPQQNDSRVYITLIKSGGFYPHDDALAEIA